MRYILIVIGLLAAALLTAACKKNDSAGTGRNTIDDGAAAAPAQPEKGQGTMKDDTATDDKLSLTEQEWKSRLTPEQYAVARCSDTEPPFTGKYWDHKGDGMYLCVCCGEPLFDSATKFNSGTGWPSFFNPAEKSAIAETHDKSHGMVRTEVKCRKCGAHLGHLFDDGPAPTGMRYCINSASLSFSDRKDKEKK